MIEFGRSRIEQIILHKVGNADNRSIELSDRLLNLDDNLNDLLKTHFLKPFKEGLLYHSQNDCQLHASMGDLFGDDFISLSHNLTKSLMEASVSPSIKTGEFFVVHFTGCSVDDQIVDAVGLFKSENKETYLKVFPDETGFEVSADQGININKIDKGAIIFNTHQEDGFIIQMYDRAGQSGSKYWQENFLGLVPFEDNYYQTQQYIQMCRDFAMEELHPDSRAEQVGLVNEAVNYFKENEVFDRGNFEKQVIREPEIIEAFEGFSKSYELENHLNNIDDFEISPQAVKHSKRFVRSVIKLDKNFHIYVHGSRERILKGFDDDKGLNFYQVYFEEER